MSRRTNRQIFWIFWLAFVYAGALLFFSGLVPEWGRWYSASAHYRAQCNALLRGELALSHSPLDLRHDLVWWNGAVHQVWGLGVPLFRVPLTAIAYLFGYPAFPDHIATGVALFVAAFFIMRKTVKVAAAEKWLGFATPALIGSATLVLLFPPFLTLFQTRFQVYEEAAAHAYLFGILEAMLLFEYFRKPTRSRWVVVMLMAGLGALVRPPLIFYGFAAWVAGTVFLFWRARCRRASHRQQQLLGCSWVRTPLARRYIGTWAIGSLLCVSGVALLLATNWARFGSPQEFGHRLNVQGIPCNASLCATRFGHPFETQPLTIVARELFGGLFFSKPLKGDDYYTPNKFPGQATAPRMREMYFTTYDWTYIPLLIAGAGLTVFSLSNWVRSKRLRGPNRFQTLMGIWCVLSLAPLFWFYLRTPALISRYMLDFAPGFAVLVAIVWSSLMAQLRGRWRTLVILCFSGWMTFQIMSSKCAAGKPMSLFQGGAIREQNNAPQESLPLGSGTKTPGGAKIPYNGSGWDPRTKRLKPHVTIFVKSPEFLELELSAAPKCTEKPDPDWVRAKIGLEFLKRESVAHKGKTWRIRFDAPTQLACREGIQAAFVMFVPTSRLAETNTPWILRSVRWRDDDSKPTEEKTN